jgi:hypothetical protein
MRLVYRIALLAAFAAVTSALTACSDFDPDKLDVFGLNEKKKLPGDRKELFPQGVPGVTQGIPPEYMKGNQPAPDTALAPPPGQTAAAEPEQKPKPKRAPKPRTVSQPAQVTIQPAPQQQPPAWPQQAQQPAQQQTQAPWPAQGQNNASDPWPTSTQPGTVAR